jgi:antitoxin HicB
MLSYPARLEKDGAAYVVSFRDIPEALTSARSPKEALRMASDALVTAMDFYFEDRRGVPMPSKPRKGEAMVELSASVAAKVLLLNTMLSERVTPATLARKLRTTPLTITRIVDLHHATKIDTIAEALKVLDKKLVLSVAEA